MTEILLIVLATALWGSVYWPVYLVLRAFLIGSSNAEFKSTIIALFWPITVPVGLLLLMVLGRWRW